MLSLNFDWTRFIEVDTQPYAVEYLPMEVRLFPDWKKSVYIEWDVPPDDLGQVPTFKVYSSMSELGPFRAVTGSPITDPFYTTERIDSDSNVADQYYTIEVSYPDGRIFRSYPKAPENDIPAWQGRRFRNIQRREVLLLDKFVGVESIIFIPKTFGPRCPHCWDDVHQKVMNDHCEHCYGTGFEGGYHTGMRTLLQYNPTDKRADAAYFGISENIMITAWTISFPSISPRAMIVRVPDRKVYRVEGHQGTTEMLTNTVRQQFVLKELSKDAIEQTLANREDTKDILTRQPHVHH